MSPVEQRKVLCSITFHVVAITCVVWSLYVLIERTAEEMRSGVLEWPFWTKLVVVAIGKDQFVLMIRETCLYGKNHFAFSSGNFDFIFGIVRNLILFLHSYKDGRKVLSLFL